MGTADRANYGITVKGQAAPKTADAESGFWSPGSDLSWNWLCSVVFGPSIGMISPPSSLSALILN